MKIIPAIDIKNGRCVRLVQGDPGKETVYCEDPIAQARTFAEAGAELIHVVDLDGAFAGLPINKEIVKKIAETITVPIEIGGGIRSADVIDEYRNSGIRRFIVGTAALEDVPAFEEMVKRFGDEIIVGVDAKSAKVATRGWLNVSSVSAIEFMDEMMKMGISEFIYTDISTDGMLKGPNIPAIKEVLSSISDIRLVASGGVSSLDDIRNLVAVGDPRLVGCIVGKAIYDGRIMLTDALSIV